MGERASSTYSLLRRPWETDVHVRRRLLVHVVPYVLGPRVLDQLLKGRTTSKMVTPALAEQKWAHAAGTLQRAGQGHPPRFRTCPCPCTACSPQALHTPILHVMVPNETGDARTGGAKAHGWALTQTDSGRAGWHGPASHAMLRKKYGMDPARLQRVLPSGRAPSLPQHVMLRERDTRCARFYYEVQRGAY